MELVSKYALKNHVLNTYGKVEIVKRRFTKAIILPVVLYGCETWSLTLREECRLRVFKNRRGHVATMRENRIALNVSTGGGHLGRSRS